MEQLIKDELIEEYRAVYDAMPQEAFELDLRLTIKTMQALAKGKPVTPDELTSIWEMPLEQVQAVLAQATGRVELDSQGNLVGGVLSLNPTPHHISTNGEQLYAWCAYDAIYAPGVLDSTAQIDSQDPITGESIHVTITPDGMVDVQPEGTVVSIVGGNTDMRGGPESPRCNQMLFFGSRKTANQWRNGRRNIAILTVEEALEVAGEFQIEPARRLGLV